MRRRNLVRNEIGPRKKVTKLFEEKAKRPPSEGSKGARVEEVLHKIISH